MRILSWNCLQKLICFSYDKALKHGKEYLQEIFCLPSSHGQRQQGGGKELGLLEARILLVFPRTNFATDHGSKMFLETSVAWKIKKNQSILILLNQVISGQHLLITNHSHGLISRSKLSSFKTHVFLLKTEFWPKHYILWLQYLLFPVESMDFIILSYNISSIIHTGY